MAGMVPFAQLADRHERQLRHQVDQADRHERQLRHQVDQADRLRWPEPEMTR